MEWWYMLLVLSFSELVLHILGIGMYASLNDKWYVFVIMPSDLKYHTDMNWFGCIICYIGLFILFPILNICKVIYWLFHI